MDIKTGFTITIDNLPKPINGENSIHWAVYSAGIINTDAYLKGAMEALNLYYAIMDSTPDKPLAEGYKDGWLDGFLITAGRIYLKTYQNSNNDYYDGASAMIDTLTGMLHRSNYIKLGEN